MKSAASVTGYSVTPLQPQVASQSSLGTRLQALVFRDSSSGTRLQALVFHGESLRCVRDTQARRPTAKTEGMVSDYGPHTQAGCVRSPDARVQ